MSGNALVFDVDLSLVVSSLEYLTPSNSMVMVKHKGLTGKTTLSERWYGTQYSIRPFTKHEMSKWSNCLAEGKIESSDSEPRALRLEAQRFVRRSCAPPGASCL